MTNNPGSAMKLFLAWLNTLQRTVRTSKPSERIVIFGVDCSGVVSVAGDWPIKGSQIKNIKSQRDFLEKGFPVCLAR